MGIPSEWELWACANEMIRQHGADAGTHAAMSADAQLALGDLDGARTWRLILRRIEDLLGNPSEARH